MKQGKIKKLQTIFTLSKVFIFNTFQKAKILVFNYIGGLIKTFV